MTLLAFLALLLPGFAWWAWLGRRDQDPIISLAQILGISLAVITVLAEVVFLFNGRFTSPSIGMLLSALLVISSLGLMKKGLRFPNKNHLLTSIGLALFSGVIAWRLFQARDLLLPSWVDSQHHYLIIKVILENGGLPADLSPYLPVPFFYHYGFHAVTAFFTGLSGLPIGGSMLLLGQVLNAAIGLSIYALGRALWRDWRPAALAALLASFATRMPAYYLSWGRYTLIIGLILLPLAMAKALELLRESPPKSGVFTLGLLTAGVLLSHYFAALLLAIFLVVLALVYLIRRWNVPLSAILVFYRVPLGALLGLLLAGPWLLRLAAYSKASRGIEMVIPQAFEAIFEISRWEYLGSLVGPASNIALLTLAGVGLLWAIIRQTTLTFSAWSLLLGVLSLPIGLTLRPFRPDHFAIVLFLPIVLWVGWLSWQVGNLLKMMFNKPWLAELLLLTVLLAFTAWSFPLSLNIVNPVTTLVSEDDLEALNWINENTPEDARFFINTTYWLNNVYRGVDGGGWLLPYTGRWALVPTVFYGFSPDQAYRQQLQDWGERASQITTCSEDFWTLIEEAELDWVYLREGSGSLQPIALEDYAGITSVYTNDTVWIFAVQD